MSAFRVLQANVFLYSRCGFWEIEYALLICLFVGLLFICGFCFGFKRLWNGSIFFSLAHNREWESASIQYNFIQLNCGLVEPTKISFKDIQTDTRRNSLCWLTMQKREREREWKKAAFVTMFPILKFQNRTHEKRIENERMRVSSMAALDLPLYISHTIISK